MPAGWYYYDYGLISAVPTVGLYCCDFWAQFFSRLKQTFIDASELFLLKLVLFSLSAARLYDFKLGSNFSNLHYYNNFFIKMTVSNTQY